LTKIALAPPPPPHYQAAMECGRSSGVEHNLAKVRVVSSNLIARSKITDIFLGLMRFAAAFPMRGTPQTPPQFSLLWA
jgi:hypothetical protein